MDDFDFGEVVPWADLTELEHNATIEQIQKVINDS